MDGPNRKRGVGVDGTILLEREREARGRFGF